MQGWPEGPRLGPGVIRAPSPAPRLQQNPHLGHKQTGVRRRGQSAPIRRTHSFLDSQPHPVASLPAGSGGPSGRTRPAAGKGKGRAGSSAPIARRLELSWSGARGPPAPQGTPAGWEETMRVPLWARPRPAGPPPLLPSSLPAELPSRLLGGDSAIRRKQPSRPRSINSKLEKNNKRGASCILDPWRPSWRREEASRGSSTA